MKESEKKLLVGALVIGGVYLFARHSKQSTPLADQLVPFASSPTEGQGQTYTVGQTVMLEVYGTKPGVVYGTNPDLTQARTVDAILSQASGAGFVATVVLSNSSYFALGSQVFVTPSMIKGSTFPVPTA